MPVPISWHGRPRRRQPSGRTWLRTTQANSAMRGFSPAPAGEHQIERLHGPASPQALAGQTLEAALREGAVGVDDDHHRGRRGRQVADAKVERVALAAPSGSCALDDLRAGRRARRWRSVAAVVGHDQQSVAGCAAAAGRVAIAAAIPAASSCAGIRIATDGRAASPGSSVPAGRPRRAATRPGSEHARRAQRRPAHRGRISADDRRRAWQRAQSALRMALRANSVDQLARLRRRRRAGPARGRARPGPSRDRLAGGGVEAVSIASASASTSPAGTSQPSSPWRDQLGNAGDVGRDHRAARAPSLP